jgi:hypothetical protein
MTPQKRQNSMQKDRTSPALELMPAPRSSKDVVVLLEYAAHLGLADTKLVAHLAEMGTLYESGGANIDCFWRIKNHRV